MTTTTFCTDRGAAILPYGAFFGRFEGERQAGEFALAHLVPTVPEAEVTRHTHTEAHFVLVLEGCYLSSAEGAPEVGGPGTLIYNPPGTVHRDRFRGDGGRFFTISVPSGVLHEFAGAVALPSHPVAPGASAGEVALRMAERARSVVGSPSLELEALGVELLDLLAVALTVARGAAPAWLVRARALLYDECGQDLALGEVARQVGVHPVHLTRAFRRHFMSTPGDYLRRCRLNRAAALLLGGRLPLIEIGLACGYFDQAHFSRSFKHAFGVSPREYRARSGGRRPSELLV